METSLLEKKSPVIIYLEEMTQRWLDEESTPVDESLEEFCEQWLQKPLPENEILIKDNEKQESSFVMRKQSASRAPGPHPDMIRAHNIPRGDGT